MYLTNIKHVYKSTNELKNTSRSFGKDEMLVETMFLLLFSILIKFPPAFSQLCGNAARCFLFPLPTPLRKQMRLAY